MLPLKTYIKNPKSLLTSLWIKKCYRLSDKWFLMGFYFFATGRLLSLKNPQTFNEKIQWLKLYDRRPEYTMMVDKYAVKDYVAGIIGQEHIIPTLGVWDRPEDIDFDMLPQQFVLKTTHGGGSCGVIICKDKSVFDINAALEKLHEAMNQNIYAGAREWAYKNVRPRIIAEKYIIESNGELNDYKVFTFGGEPKLIELDYNRYKGHQRNLYDFNWNRIEATIQYPSDEKRVFDKPSVLNDLYDYSKRLSECIPHVRIDYYIIDSHIYFGEMTFYHGSGVEKISPRWFDLQLGEWIKLPVPVGTTQIAER